MTTLDQSSAFGSLTMANVIRAPSAGPSLSDSKQQLSIRQVTAIPYQWLDNQRYGVSL